VVWVVAGRAVLETAERRYEAATVAAVAGAREDARLPDGGGEPAGLGRRAPVGPPREGADLGWPHQRRRIVAWLAASWTVAAGVLTVAWLARRPRRNPRARTAEDDEWRALQAVSAAFEAGRELPRALADALEGARRVFRCEAALAYRFDPHTHRLTLLARGGAEGDDVDRIAARPPRAAVAEALRQGRVTAASPEPRPPSGRNGPTPFRTQVVVPIVVGGTPWGVLVLLDVRPRPLDAPALRALQTVGLLVATGVAQHTLRGETEEKGRRLDSLTRLAQSLAGTLVLDEVLQRVVDAGVHVFRSSVSRLWLLDEDGRHLNLRAFAGTRTPVTGLTRLPVGEGIVGTVVATGRPLTVLDATTDPRVRNRDRILAEGVVSVAAVPVVAGDRILGALSVAVRERHEYGPDELALLSSLATYAAIAIDNARLFAEEQSRRDQLTVLLEINKKIGAAEPTEALLTAIAEEAARLLDVDNAGFRLVEGDELVLAGLAGTARETMRRARIRIGESFSGKVVAEGRTLMLEAGSVPDMVPEHRTREHELGYTHYLGVPLRVGNRIIGAFAFRARRPFTERDRELAETFAGQAAIALEHARLYREASRQAAENARLLALETQRRNQIETLAALERELAAELNLDRLLHLIVQRAKDLLAAEGIIYLAQDDRTLAPSARTEGAHADDRIPFGLGLVGACARERRGLLANDYPASPYARSRFVALGVRHGIVQPLLLRDRLLGVVGMFRFGAEPPPFTEDELDTLGRLANQAAVAVENARLYDETERRRREAEELAGLARRLTETLDLDEVCHRVVENAPALFGVATAGIWLLQPDGSLVARAYSGGPSDILPVGYVLEPGVGMAGRAVQEGRPVASTDVLDDPAVVVSEDLRRRVEATGNRAALATPLRVKGRTIGALVVADPAGRAFSAGEAALLQALADQAALAIENARLLEETERRRRDADERLRETSTLLAISRVLADSLPRDESLRRVARETARALGADMAGAYVLDETSQRLVPAAGYRLPPRLREWFRDHPIPIDRLPRLRQAWEDGTPIWSRHVHEDDRFDREWVASLPPHALLVAPLRVRGQSVGALFLVWWTPGREPSEAELRLLEGVAAQVGLALENAELERQRERRVRELTVLHELSRAVTGQLDRQALLDTLRARVPAVLDADQMVVLLLDRARGEFEVALRVLDGVIQPGPPPRVGRDVGLAGVVAEARRPLRTDDYAAECARRGTTPPPGRQPTCWVGAPMIAAGEVLGVLTVSRDRRPFTESDEGLIANIADLAALALRSARLYEDRTRAYAELEAAQDQLVRTEKLRALGEMASGVAHDFNNLLAAILGRAQLLLRRLTDPTLRQWVQVIERSALDGAHTVRRLQDFARVRQDQPLVPVDLAQVVRDALEITQSRWREEALRQGISIEVRTELAEAPPVLGDPVELREAMTNLILNALDAMPEGGTLTLRTAVMPDGVEVSVSDTGVGIPAAIRDRIFDPFFTTKGPKGTGLGLSMTYGIVSRHRARIAVDSEEGRGTTFRVTFPADRPPVPAAPSAAPPSTPAPVRLRCLVVDDEEAVGAVMGDVLEAIGHEAVVVASGAEALERLSTERFDAVFTDLAMPGVSGWQVVDAVRQRTPDVPVFVVTGFGVEIPAEERSARGVEAVYPKPLTIEDMLDAVGRVARRRAHSSPSEGS
jgi:GAF domain-containing protein/ActR/RegA family two-component response regulator